MSPTFDYATASHKEIIEHCDKLIAEVIQMIEDIKRMNQMIEDIERMKEKIRK